MKLSELVKVDSRFEKSINLSLDLEDPTKVNYYIPTRSALKILEGFLDNITVQARNRASILIGPYGKGKSHLLLVLMAILSRPGSPEVKELLGRIGKISPETVDKIKNAMKKGGRFLPVIVNPSNGTLYSILLKSIQQAFRREGITDVDPDSYYTEAVNTINSWKKDYPDAYAKFGKLVGKDVDGFIDLLRDNDEDTLERFKAAFSKINNGSAFTPIIDEDIKTVLMSVNKRLCSKHGYKGIYIIFDEFSKYIEGHGEDGFAADMATLQDVCEVCSKSKDEQLHLTLVAHKAIRAYGSRLPQTVINTFEAIEGRLAEVKFITSSQNNYELIADALQKTAKFDGWAKKSALYKELGSKAFELVFQTIFNEDEYWSIVAKGAFPLTPVGAMLLLSLSEKIAQNERTIFTYLTDESSGGLASLITTDNAGMVSAGNIYDYFIPLFREDSDNSIHHVWLKADYAISKTESKPEKDILKAMAIIKMVNRPDELPASDKFIRLACGMEEKAFNKALVSLVSSSLIEYKSYSMTYEYKNNIGVDVEIAISDCMASRFTRPDCAEVLYEVMSRKNELPKKHNGDRCITRYFSYRFMTAEAFLAVPDVSCLSWKNRPDGSILLVLPEDKLDRATLKKHIKELGDKCTLMMLPDTDSTKYVDKVKYLLAVRYLEKDAKFTEGDPVLLKELRDIEEETVSALDTMIDLMYFVKLDVYGCGGKIKTDAHGINRIVSDICDSEYSMSPVLNHEMVNCRKPTSAIVKARNNVVRDLLEGNELEEYRKGTSSESTICRALLLNTEKDKGLKAVNKEIEAFMKASIDSRVSFSEIVDKLTRPPYGVREGVLPVLLAKQLVAFGEIPVIYLNDKEVSINENILGNAVDSPFEYSIHTESKTISKLDYLSKLEALFEEYSINCAEIDGRNKLAKLTCMMQSWYRSLPQTSITFSNMKDTEKMKEIVAFRKIFQNPYINPREVILEKIPKVFKTENLDAVYTKIRDIKHLIDFHIHEVRTDAINALLNALGITKGGNLRQALKSWYENLSDEAKDRVYSNATNDFVNYVKSFTVTDPESIIRDVAKIVTGIFIEDWNDDSAIDFLINMEAVVQEIVMKSSESSSGSSSLQIIGPDGKEKKVSYNYDPEKISTNGTFFQNQLYEVFENSEGVDADEKLGILMDMIKEMMR